MKKSVLILFLIIILASFVIAEKIEISTDDQIAAGQMLTLKVSIYDYNNNLIKDDLEITIRDAGKTQEIKQTISSDNPVNINLGENAPAGLWTIKATYKDIEATTVFSIESNKLVKFDIVEDKLIIKNIGNTKYSETVQILIGESVGSKDVELEIGEETSFRLIAPDGTYNVVVTDGETEYRKSDIQLTGKVIGILDEELVSGSSPVTGGLKPSEEEESFYSGIKNSSFVYVFILAIIGAGILLAVERKFRKKV